MSTTPAIPRIDALQIFEPHQLESAAAQMIEDGFAVFRRPGLRPLVTEMEASWRVFCAQPMRRKKRWEVSLPADPQSEPDNGFIRKYLELVGSGEARKDDKAFFHWRPFVQQWVRERAHLRPNTTELRFLIMAAKLHAQLQQTLFTFADALDRTLPGYDIRAGTNQCVAPDVYGHVLRMLLYLTRPEPGALLGKPHTDRDAITLHVADSRPGLVVFLRDGERFVLPTKPDTLIVFAGQQLAVRTEGRIRALHHEVRHPADQPPGTDQRTCTVFFGYTGDDVEKYDHARMMFI